jgi:hypothetical protein
MFDRKLVNIVGATLTCNLRHDWSLARELNYYDVLNSVGSKVNDNNYTYNLNKDSQKISQFHHYHVKLNHLFKGENVVLHGNEALFAEFVDSINNIESTHTTFWVYYRALDTWTRNVFVGMIKHYGSHGRNFSWLKDEGMWAKQMQGYAGLEITKLFELNVLVNRLDTAVDWSLEKDHRIKPVLAQVEPTEVYRHCVQLFGDAKVEGKHACKYTYQDYWEQRAIIMPGGSVHSEILEDVQLAKTLDYRLKTKKGLFSAMKDVTHEHWLSRPAEIHSYTSTKYEWGKTRALYGCDITSHLHSDFALNKCEETFPAYIPTGSKANAEYVDGIADNLKHLIPFCYDYDDFNSQHSFENMQAVLRAWRHVYAGDLSNEQNASLDWTITSIMSQYVHNSATNDVYKTAGTLFSGWRLTTFVNTALNYAYLAAAGIKTKMAYSLHNGDDVLGAARNIGDILDVLKASNKLSIRAQSTKMNIGTIAEFLRMDFRAKSRTGKQYLTRGCATFVHSRIESGSPQSKRAVYSSTAMRESEILARGADKEFVASLVKLQTKYIEKIFGGEDLYSDYIKTDLVAGGMYDSGLVGNYELKDEFVPGEVDINFDVIYPGIKDFVTLMARRVPSLRGHVSVERAKKSIQQTYNVQRSILTKVKSSKQRLSLELSLKHVWRNVIHIGKFAKARMTVPDLFVALSVASKSHARALEDADDPYHMISIML